MRVLLESRLTAQIGRSALERASARASCTLTRAAGRCRRTSPTRRCSRSSSAGVWARRCVRNRAGPCSKLQWEYNSCFQACHGRSRTCLTRPAARLGRRRAQLRHRSKRHAQPCTEAQAISAALESEPLPVAETTAEQLFGAAQADRAAAIPALWRLACPATRLASGTVESTCCAVCRVGVNRAIGQ